MTFSFKRLQRHKSFIGYEIIVDERPIGEIYRWRSQREWSAHAIDDKYIGRFNDRKAAAKALWAMPDAKSLVKRDKEDKLSPLVSPE